MPDKSGENKTSKASVDQAAFLYGNAVTKAYRLRDGNSLTVLDNIDFQLIEHSVSILLGPSGCGKSTLLNLVAGLDKPTTGDIFIEGKRILGPARDRGMVFQNYSCYPWLTVRQNVEFGLRLHRDITGLKEGIADYFLERVKLVDFADAYPDQLSGGMRQRVAIARALSLYPKLLLMDEPFGALDAVTRWQMQELLIEIVEREKITVLMVTHDINEALFLGDEILFMSIKPGRIKQVIRPEFHTTSRLTSKDALFDHPNYRIAERHVMSLMREEEQE